MDLNLPRQIGNAFTGAAPSSGASRAENVGDEVAFVQPLLCCFHFASLYNGTGSSNPVRSTPEEVLRRRWRLVD